MVLRISQTFYGHAHSTLLVPSYGWILKSVCPFHPATWRPGADSLSLAFPRTELTNAQVCGLSPSCRFRPAFCACSLAFCQSSLKLPLGMRAGSQPQGTQWVWVRHIECCGAHAAAGGDPQSRHPQWLVCKCLYLAKVAIKYDTRINISKHQTPYLT